MFFRHCNNFLWWFLGDHGILGSLSCLSLLELISFCLVLRFLSNALGFLLRGLHTSFFDQLHFSLSILVLLMLIVLITEESTRFIAVDQLSFHGVYLVSRVVIFKFILERVFSKPVSLPISCLTSFTFSISSFAHSDL